MKLEQAVSIAETRGLTRHDIQAPPFILASWQKINAPGEPVNLYIEGDGLAWLSRSTPSGNPTPKIAQALQLAAVDPSPNVIYIARPCQFTEIGAPGNACPREYWMGKRFAPEVVASFNSALNQMTREYGISGFNLVGFSGGANVAGLLAAHRSDIVSLRTVAGNLDNDYFTNFHKVSPMPGSLNMADLAAKLSGLPQRHFIGGRDKFVPTSVFESYQHAAGPSPCIHMTYNENAEHMKGWTDRWPEFMALPVSCSE